LTWPEIEDLTLAQFEALEERRMIAVRHSRFNAGLLASLMYNANRGPDSDPLEVWDFVPGFERDTEEVEADKLRRSIRQGVLIAFSRMQNKTLQDVREEAKAMVQRMAAEGVEDADGIVREVFEDVIKQPLEE
jgi:hypothetical protein